MEKQIQVPADDEEDGIGIINTAIRTGDENYWRKVYNAYFVPLKVFISREFGPLPADIAEELSSRALLKLVGQGRRPQFMDKRQLTAWLYKAARTTALDYWRSPEGKGHRVTDLMENDEEMTIEMPETFDGLSPDCTLVTEVLGKLGESDRLLLTMRANGTPYKTIAQELGMAENASRTYFDRAKKKFVKIYRELADKPVAG